MTTAQASRAVIADAVVARLRTVSDLTVYLAVVPRVPTGSAVSAKGKVKPYAAVYPSAGSTDINPSLAPLPADFLWRAQITFAAGEPADLNAALDRAVPALNLWSPVIDGLTCGFMRPVAGGDRSFDSGGMRRDDQMKPPRYYLPTLWQLHVITA